MAKIVDENTWFSRTQYRYGYGEDGEALYAAIGID